jgi:hypothetical protein
VSQELVNHPSHYQAVSNIGAPILTLMGLGPELLKLECIEAIEILEESRISSFCYLNGVKYLWRCGLKGDPIEDLRKAQWYLRRWLKMDTPRNPRVVRRVEGAIAVVDGFIAYPMTLEGWND